MQLTFSTSRCNVAFTFSSEGPFSASHFASCEAKCRSRQFTSETEGALRFWAQEPSPDAEGGKPYANFRHSSGIG
jgi:hypothetical protein